MTLWVSLLYFRHHKLFSWWLLFTHCGLVMPQGVILVNIHYYDVIMGAIASQITSLTIVFSTVYSDADQRKHQRSASLAFLRGIHRGPLNSPHKWPVMQKMFPFDDIIMLGQVMAFCVIEPSHYMNRCWLIISEFLWHSLEANFAGIDQGLKVLGPIKCFTYLWKDVT